MTDFSWGPMFVRDCDSVRHSVMIRMVAVSPELESRELCLIPLYNCTVHINSRIQSPQQYI